MTVLNSERPHEQPRRVCRPTMRLGAASGVLLVAVIVLAGCGDDDSGDGDGDSVAFCEAIERADNANPFAAEAREPDLDLFLAGLDEMSAAYKANVPSEIKAEFEVFASEATQRYDAALAIDDPTDQTVDAVIFGGTGEGPSEEFFVYINTECGTDL